MRRRIFTLASAVSLFLCLLILCLWASTLGGEWYASRDFEHGALDIRLYHRGITVLVQRTTYRHPFNRHWSIERFMKYGGSSSDDVWGFNLSKTQAFDKSWDELKLGLPYWLLTAAFAILPWRWYSAHRRSKRLSEPSPSCKTCGYSLTGNTSGTCPECGTASAGKMTSAAP